MKKLIIIIVVLIVGTAAVLRSGFFKKEDSNLIRLSGNIELTQVDISFKTAGRLATLNVKEGSKVNKGMLIAQLDQTTTLRSKDQQQAGLESANAQLAQIITGIQFQKEQIEGDLQLRRAELHTAESQLADLQAGSRPQEINQAKAAAEDAKSWFQQASEDWTRAQKLFKNEDISRSQYDQFRARYESMRQALTQAEQRLALVEEGPRKQQIETAKSQVERARAAIRVAEANRIELKRRQQEVAVRNAEIGRAKAGVSIVDSQLDDTSVSSPIDGVVLVKSAEAGEVLAAGATVVSIGDIEHPWLRGFVAEKDLGRVKLNGKVKLTTDSYPGKIYWGRISFIASEAEFTPKQIQTADERVKLVYKIKIEVDNPNQELKANMPVDAEIVL